MGKLVTVTAKVSEDVLRRLKALDVNVSGLIREILEREIERLERERLCKLADKASEALRGIPVEELVRVIRESRDER